MRSLIIALWPIIFIFGPKPFPVWIGNLICTGGVAGSLLQAALRVAQNTNFNAQIPQAPQSLSFTFVQRVAQRLLAQALQLEHRAAEGL